MNTPSEEQKIRIDEVVTDILTRYDLSDHEFLLVAESVLGIAVTAFDIPVVAYIHAKESLESILKNNGGESCGA